MGGSAWIWESGSDLGFRSPPSHWVKEGRLKGQGAPSGKCCSRKDRAGAVGTENTVPTALSPRVTAGRGPELLLSRDRLPNEPQRPGTAGQTVDASTTVSVSIQASTSRETRAQRRGQLARSYAANPVTEPEPCLLPRPVICVPFSPSLTPHPNERTQRQLPETASPDPHVVQAWRNEAGHYVNSPSGTALALNSSLEICLQPRKRIEGPYKE